MFGHYTSWFSCKKNVAVVVPIFVGAILGNLDPEMRAFLTKGSNALIPFMAFGLGMTIDLKVFITGTACYLAFKLFKWNPIVGVAEGAVAGNAIATPAAIAAVSASFAAEVGLATVQVAAIRNSPPYLYCFSG